MNDKSKKARSNFWISGATDAHKGSLRRELGAKPGKPIPEAKLEAAAKGDSTKAKRARLAITLRGLGH